MKPSHLSWRTAGLLALAALVGAPGCEFTAIDGGAGLRQGVSPGEIELALAGAEELAAEIDRRRGQVVLVDFWATWCNPCKGKMPHTVALAEEFEGRGFAVITVSLDSPDESHGVKEFLAEVGAKGDNITHFVSKYKTGEAVTAFEIGDSIPYYKVYDREGVIAPFPIPDDRKFSNQVIRSLVTNALGPNPPP